MRAKCAHTLCFVLVLTSSIARADVFQWAWQELPDHSMIKVQTDSLCPNGAGVNPRSNLGALDLTKAYLANLDLSYTTWVDTKLDNAYFGKSNLNQMLLYHCSLQNADFTAVQGTGQFRFCDLSSADFTDATLKHFAYDDLTGANFTRADLTNASIEFCTLNGTNFTDAIINNLRLYAAIEGGFTQAQLRSTASYKNHDLHGLQLNREDLTGWDLSGTNLTLARFEYSTLASARLSNTTLGTDFQGADLTGADLSSANAAGAWFASAILVNANLAGTDLSGATVGARLDNAILTGAKIVGTDFSGSNLSAQQLYSTATYASRNLSGIQFGGNKMNGWSFHAIDLSNAVFDRSTLNGADFSGAILSGASLASAQIFNADFAGVDLSITKFDGADLRGSRNVVLASVTGLDIVLPDGTYTGFAPGPGFIRVRNYSGPTAIPIHMTQDLIRPIQFVFALDADPWQSTMNFKPGITVDITGTRLVLDFGDGVDASPLFGQSFHLFDWTGVDPIGQFELWDGSPYAWDTSRLYTDGVVTLLGVPEPGGVAVLALAGLALSLRRGAPSSTSSRL